MDLLLLWTNFSALIVIVGLLRGVYPVISYSNTYCFQLFLVVINLAPSHFIGKLPNSLYCIIPSVCLFFCLFLKYLCLVLYTKQHTCAFQYLNLILVPDLISLYNLTQSAPFRLFLITLIRVYCLELDISLLMSIQYIVRG